jgi:predicted nuclease of predicted toxin-antitoxin system
MNLLFDEHCSGNYFSNKSEIDNDHTSICIGHHDNLPSGMEDESIIEYAKNNDLIIVTKDVKFVKKCSKQNIKVAVLKGNYLFLVQSSVKMFGREPDDRLFPYD